ncbi:hypothetical protein [Streptomyces antibioticus]|uniref:hypothetical protein n=1 Tax=Streptomyces antibioticus TaxID=1890 RepID=UPI003D709ACC
MAASTPKHQQELYTVIQADGSKRRDADATKRLVLSSTEAVEESAACTAGAPERPCGDGEGWAPPVRAHPGSAWLCLRLYWK